MRKRHLSLLNLGLLLGPYPCFKRSDWPVQTGADDTDAERARWTGPVRRRGREGAAHLRCRPWRQPKLRGSPCPEIRQARRDHRQEAECLHFSARTARNRRRHRTTSAMTRPEKRVYVTGGQGFIDISAAKGPRSLRPRRTVPDAGGHPDRPFCIRMGKTLRGRAAPGCTGFRGPGVRGELIRE